MAEPWLVAGLGNPGQEYAHTRHNAGALVVGRLCARLAVRLKKVRFVAVTAAEVTHQGVPLILAVATTYMNESGPPLASFAGKRDIPAHRLIAVHDEIDLPLGALRVKLGGSTAGHHGLDSLVQALRTPDFYRIRLGVGRPPGRQDPIKYVLSPFGARQRDEAELMIEEAADAALALPTAGLAEAQSRFNRNAPPAP